MKFLKSKQEYVDSYDHLTIERCHRMEKIYKKAPSKEALSYKGKKLSKAQHQALQKMVCEVAIYFIKGDEYSRKAETIQGWVARDTAKDELLETAKAPEDILCLACKRSMTPASKDLYDWGSDGKDRVLFMYACANGCLPHRAFFDNGEEWRPKSRLCSECGSKPISRDKRTQNKITTIETCSSCGHVEKTGFNLSPKKEKPDKNFEKDRARFCLTPEQGQKYLEGKIRLEQVTNSIDQWNKEEKNKDVCEKARALKKLTIVQVQKLLAPALQQQGYINLSFKEPELGREVRVEFTTQENREDRHEYDSRMDLKKLIQKTLDDTIWRLMSDGISYRLGILTGRLRAYEREEDLLKLAG